ncbi:MAG: acyl-CoA reductase-like NAD-dependent aldehyde dehydrogenase [Paracoccaceae bacterium]|jgi:acyl-CoA reductase-like NAD-dependent aldehyde dehydrogenase
MPSDRKETILSKNKAEYDLAISDLKTAKDTWAQTGITDRIEILNEIKDALMAVSASWATTAADRKGIEKDTALVGEEWISGPYALMSACNGLMLTLSKMKDKSFLNSLPKRTLGTGQLAVKVLPHNIWDRLLFSGIKAEVWMQKGVTQGNLTQNAASIYDTPADQRKGKVALILGAGNIAAIAPLDCFQKIFMENQVVILKMNPVNDYLTEFLTDALKPLIDRDALRVVKGDGAAGEYLVNHGDVEEIHITGAAATHDAIIWGVGAKGAANKKASTPINSRNMTSELGAVCPTIVVPGPWSDADIDFQAQHIATQKLHNSGFNCIACQALILPKTWDKTAKLMARVEHVINKSAPRQAYYPGAAARMQDFAGHGDAVIHVDRGSAPALVIADMDDNSDTWLESNEVFAPALSTYKIDQTDPEKYLAEAIEYANTHLYGTLGGNILIHPRTIKQIGKTRFEELVAGFHYGHVAINAWTGVGFLLTQTPWGAFPGHTLDDVQSGIGTVHNTFMLENTERTVVHAPWRPFPRNLLSGGVTLLPKPPWFITNRKQDKIGELLTKFVYRPSWLKIPRIFLNALLG